MDKAFDGYAVVTWDSKTNKAKCHWSCGGYPQSIVPEFVKSSLQRSFGQHDATAMLYPEDEGDDDAS